MYRLKFIGIFLVMLLISACGSVNQETGEDATKESAVWPTENVTVIVPFSEGGSIDRMARGLASHWEENHEYNMIVENYAGAGGILGSETFLSRPDDGQTIFIGGQPTLSMNFVTHDVNYSLDDFVFVNFEQIDYSDVVVNAGSPYDTIEDLISAIKENPGQISVGYPGGSGTQLFAAAFVDAFDLDVREVTFDGGGEMRTALLGGHIDFMISSAFGDMTLGDEIKVLAVASAETFPGWPDATPINDVLNDETNTIPPVGDNRFIAVHKSFVDNHPETFNALVESYKQTFESEKYQEYLKNNDSDIISGFVGPEKSLEISNVLHEISDRYKDLLQGE